MLDQIAGGAATAAYVGLVIASQLPFPVTGIPADMGADVLEGHVPPELAMAKKALGYASMTMRGVFVAKLGFSAIKTAVQYVYVAKNGILNSVKKAAKRIKRSPPYASG